MVFQEGVHVLPGRCEDDKPIPLVPALQLGPIRQTPRHLIHQLLFRRDLLGRYVGEE